MVYRQCPNINTLTRKEATARIKALDPDADVAVYSGEHDGVHYNHVSVQSETLTDNQITTAITGNTPIQLAAQVAYQRDALMRQNRAAITVLLYLAEDKAVSAGKLTAAQRTVPAAAAMDYALYLRKLYRLTIDGADPSKVVFPEPPADLI